MNLAKLRIENIVEDNDEVLEQLISLLNPDIDVSGIKDITDDCRKMYEFSWVNLTIANTETPSKLTEAVIDFANQCKAKNINLSSSKISANLEIGIAYLEPFCASVSFSLSELQLINSLGIALSFRAYPTSDEASENENT